MDKLQMFLTLKGEPSRRMHPKAIDPASKRSPSAATDAVSDSWIRKFHEERKRIIDVLFTGVHYNRLKTMDFETVDIQFTLYHGIGPSRIIAFSCPHLSVFDELSKTLPTPQDRLHAGCGRHNLVVATLIDETGAHDEVEIPIKQSYAEQRALNPSGREIRARLQALFDEKPKQSPLRIETTRPDIRERIVDLLSHNQRAKAQVQRHNFQCILESGEHGLLLIR